MVHGAQGHPHTPTYHLMYESGWQSRDRCFRPPAEWCSKISHATERSRHKTHKSEREAQQSKVLNAADYEEMHHNLADLCTLASPPYLHDFTLVLLPGNLPLLSFF